MKRNGTQSIFHCLNMFSFVFAVGRLFTLLRVFISWPWTITVPFDLMRIPHIIKQCVYLALQLLFGKVAFVAKIFFNVLGNNPGSKTIMTPSPLCYRCAAEASLTFLSHLSDRVLCTMSDGFCHYLHPDCSPLFWQVLHYMWSVPTAGFLSCTGREYKHWRMGDRSVCCVLLQILHEHRLKRTNRRKKSFRVCRTYKCIQREAKKQLKHDER